MFDNQNTKTKTINLKTKQQFIELLQKEEEIKQKDINLCFFMILDIRFLMGFVTFIVLKICPIFEFKYFLLIYFPLTVCNFIISFIPGIISEKIENCIMFLDVFVNYSANFVCVLLLLFTNISYYSKIINLILLNDIHFQIGFFLSMFTIIFTIYILVSVFYRCCIVELKLYHYSEKNLHAYLQRCHKMLVFFYSLLLILYLRIFIDTTYRFFLVLLSGFYILLTSLLPYITIKKNDKYSSLLNTLAVIYIFKAVYVILISCVIFYEYYQSVIESTSIRKNYLIGSEFYSQ